jgi:hypothetical protein
MGNKNDVKMDGICIAKLAILNESLKLWLGGGQNRIRPVAAVF